MKTKLNFAHPFLGVALASLLFAGCAQQQQQRPAPAPAVTAAPAPAPAPVTPQRGYGPSYSTIEDNGVKWIRGSMAYPSGLRGGERLVDREDRSRRSSRGPVVRLSLRG